MANKTEKTQPAPQAAASKNSAPKTSTNDRLQHLKVFAIMVMAAVVLAGMVFFYVDTTAQKNSANTAAAEALEALKTRHIRLFEKRVDTQRLAQQVVADAFEGVNMSSLGGASGALGKRLLLVLQPSVSAQLKKQIEAYVVTGSVATASNEEPAVLQKLWQDVGTGDVADVTIDKVRSEGKSATATVLLHHHTNPIPTEVLVGMEKIDGVWRVVSLPNLGQVLANIDAQQHTTKESRNSAKQVEMANILHTTLQWKKSEQPWPANPLTMLEIEFDNTGKQDITTYRYEVTLNNLNTGDSKVVELTEDELIAAGGAVEKNIPLMMDITSDVDAGLFNADSESIRLSLKGVEMVFADGTSIVIEN